MTRKTASASAISATVTVKLTIKGKARRVQAKAKEVAAARLPGTETPTEPTPTTTTPTGPTGPTALFGTPAAALVGQPAAEAVVPFLLDARFTDCVAGWPNCAVEHRYSQFASGDHYYCHLTSTSGADINSYANNLTVTGANQATDGSWAVSYAVCRTATSSTTAGTSPRWARRPASTGDRASQRPAHRQTC